MSAYRQLARAVAVTGAALIGVGLAGAPAMAADASAELARLPSRMTAGGNSAPLLGSVTNRSRETLPEVQVMFTIQLSGLAVDQVSLGGLPLTEEDGRIRAVEQISPPAPRRSTIVRHDLRFLAGAPGGSASVSMDVFLREGGEWRRVDNARTGTSVQGVRGTPTTAPPSVQPGPADVSPGATTQAPAAAAQPRPPADEGAALWPLYALGLLLVGGGGAVVALLLLRRQRDDAPVYAPGYVPDAPTVVMPAITALPDPDDSTSPGSGRHRDGF